MQPVENVQNALLERGAAHDAVVDDDQIILGIDAAIGNIIHVRGQVVARIALSDERAQLYIFPSHLFRAHVFVENLFQFGPRGDVSERLDALDFLLVHIAFEAVEQSVKDHLGCVWNKGEDSMTGVMAHGPEHLGGELLA